MLFEIDTLRAAGVPINVTLSANDLEQWGMKIYEQGRKDAEAYLNNHRPYTREEVASIMHVSVRTIDAWRKDGVFGERAKKGLDKVGARVLLPRDIVDKMINK